MFYIIVSVISVLVLSMVNCLAIQKLESKKGNQSSWWNKLTGRTLVLNARFGAWSEKTVVISLGGIAIPFKRLLNKSVFSFTIFLIIRSFLYKFKGHKMLI
jgi:hypothetical protein